MTKNDENATMQPVENGINITFDDRNYRKHNGENKKLIAKSLRECGAGRSITTDNTGKIIAGNGVYEQAVKLNIPIKVVETRGNELIVVKRLDVSPEDDKRKRLAVMDNSASDSSDFDEELLKADFDIGELNDLGVNITDMNVDEGKFSEAVGTVIYEPGDSNHSVSELYKNNDDVLKDIDSIKDPELREFFRARAYSLTTFNFQKIADYYAYQATAEEQRMFERLALVLLDKDKLIENGFSDILEFTKNDPTTNTK